MSGVLIIVARRYNHHELWGTLAVLKRNNITYKVLSTHPIIVSEKPGKAGLELAPQINRLTDTLDTFKPSQAGSLDGLMIISGHPTDTLAYWDDPRALEWVDYFHKANMSIAGICCSVPTIRHAAGGKEVSHYPLRRATKLLKEAGAILSPKSLSVSENLVTAEHEMYTEQQTQEFANLLLGRPREFYPKATSMPKSGFERKPVPEIEEIIRRTRSPKRD